MNSGKMESNPIHFPGFRCLRAAASFSGLKGSEIMWPSGVGIFHRSDSSLLISLVDLRSPGLCATFLTSCEAMEFAKTGHLWKERPDLPISLLMALRLLMANKFVDGLHALRLECETSMKFTASSHRSCFFCPSRDSRDKAALSESVPTGSRMKDSESRTLCPAWHIVFRWPLGILCWPAECRLSQNSSYAPSIFDVSGGDNLSTDSSVRRQKCFQSALRKFQRFAGSLWAAVIAWLESMTRLDSSHDFWSLELDFSHIEKNGDSTRLVLRFSQNDSSRVTVSDSRLESESFLQNLWVPDGQTQFACTQRNEHFLLLWLSRLAEIFCFDLFSRAMLHFKDRVSPTCIEGDLRLCFHWGVSRAQYIDALSWFKVVFAYRDHGRGPHTVTLCLLQIPVKWFKFFRFQSKPKTVLQNIMQMRKPNLV